MIAKLYKRSHIIRYYLIIFKIYHKNFFIELVINIDFHWYISLLFADNKKQDDVGLSI